MSALPWRDIEAASLDQRKRRREISSKAIFAMGTIAAYSYVFWVVLAVWPG